MPVDLSEEALAKKRAKHAADQRKWRAENPDKWTEIAGKSRKKWKVENRDEHREAQRENRRLIRIDILNILGGCVCAKCGFGDWRALQIDHIHGGGYSDTRLKRNIHWIKNWIVQNLEQAKSEYQILCANCNWIKKHENEEFGTGGWTSYWERKRANVKSRQGDLDSDATDRTKILSAGL